MTKKEKSEKVRLAPRLYAAVGLALCTALPVIATLADTKTPKYLGD